MKRFIRSLSIATLLFVLLFHVNIVAIAETEVHEDIEDVSGDATEEIGTIESEAESSDSDTTAESEDIDTTEESVDAEDSEDNEESEATENATPVSSDDTYWLVLDNYSVSGDRLIAGNDSVLTLKIANKNAKLNATNVMVTIYGDSSTIMPKEGLSNQFFADSVPAGSVKDVEIPISVSEGVTGNQHLDVKIDYVYNNQGILSNQFSINIPVYLSSIVTEEMTLSENGDLSVKFLNSGTRDIYNVTAHLNGDMSGVENFYIGNIEAGKDGVVSIPVSFLSSGNKNIKIHYSYKNDNGILIQSDEESFLVAVQDNGFSHIENGSEDSNKGISLSVICILIICLVVIIGSLYYGFVIKNKRK